MSTLYRYTAVALGTAGAHAQEGRLAADSPAAVRASLRRAGLRVLDVRPVRAAARPMGMGVAAAELLASHRRRRRTPAKAELFDSLATMLESGLPLLEAVETVMACAPRGMSASMLAGCHESLRSGRSLAAAAGEHAGWFDPAEGAMIAAGEHGGDLPAVLRGLALRHERSSELSAKLTGVLAYPAIVACVGLGVTVFLSTRTLPALTKILTDNKVPTPRLTLAVMACGQAVAHGWLPLASCAAAGAVGSVLLVRRQARATAPRPPWVRRLRPRVFRRVAVARVALQLAELTRSGVPMVESLRVVAPTAGGSLGRALSTAAGRVERGDTLAEALDDGFWFDPEFRRLLAVGQATGELPALLGRLGARHERGARRMIDRLATLLEPAVIMALAALVGTVVMAAVLPLIRLQEVIR